MKTVKMDRIEYAIDTKSIIGIKSLRIDFYLTENEQGILIPEVKIYILSSNIKDFGTKYAQLTGNRLYLFISALERATYYKNFIYSFPYPESFKGGVKMLMVRMDSKKDGKDDKPQGPVGVVAMNFYEPLKAKNIKESDKSSTFFYLQPLEMLGLSYRMRETLTAMKTISYSVKYGKDIIRDV